MLNHNQKSHLGITLGVVEEELKRLRQRLQEGEEIGLFSHTGDDLTAEEKTFLNGKIECLMASMIYLKNFFDLRHSHKELSLRAVMKAIAVYLQVELEDVKSDRLKGYGEVQPGLKQTLDPKLNEMISILNEMETGI